MEGAFRRCLAGRSTMPFPCGWTMEGHEKFSPSWDAGRGSVGCSFHHNSYFPVVVVVVI